MVLVGPEEPPSRAQWLRHRGLAALLVLRFLGGDELAVNFFGSWMEVTAVHTTKKAAEEEWRSLLCEECGLRSGCECGERRAHARGEPCCDDGCGRPECVPCRDWLAAGAESSGGGGRGGSGGDDMGWDDSCGDDDDEFVDPRALGLGAGLLY